MEEASLSFDRRRHPRIRMTIPVQYQVINDTNEALASLEAKPRVLSGNSQDFSAEGLFLVSTRLLEAGDILKLEILLPNDQAPVRIFSEVIWVSDHGLAEDQHGAGIYFMAMRDEDADRIGRMVADMLKHLQC